MGEAIEERGGHLGIAEHASPFAEAQVCGDGDAGTLVELAECCFSANGSSLLGRSGTLKRGSTVPARRYLRIVLRDNPVRRSISRIGIPSRKYHRRITLSNAMSITPRPSDLPVRREVQTWVTSR